MISQAGNGANMSPADWASDIAMAKAAKIDGFAMNIAAGDPNTDIVLANAYAAAEAASGFNMFLSFDYLSMGAWNAGQVINKINQYKFSSAQFLYHGKPLASTFEGVGNIGDWAGIKSATGCFFIPDWSSLGPAGFASHLNIADGAFSWDAWPEGARDKTTDADNAWMQMLGGKPFMMPVSPWFYTNMPNWGKNWLWRGDDLWYDRWQEVVRLQPSMVQILTWNDFGEAHYIGPIHEGGIPDGAHYVPGMPHEAWLKFLPHYIDAYKSGNNTSLDEHEEAITYWYKVNPGWSGSTGGTTGNNPGQGQPAVAPQFVSQDKVFVSVLVAQPSDVAVQIGGGQPTPLRAMLSGINHFSVPLNGQTGAVHVKVLRNGAEIVSATGPEITTACKDGLINWNAYVGSS
jgi:Glycosyl hydrolase family 71